MLVYTMSVNKIYIKFHYEQFKNQYTFEEYFNNSRALPSYEVKCGCGHEIIRNEYIYNKKTKQIKVVGSTCIKHWTSYNNLKDCTMCGLITKTQNGICKSCKSVTVNCPCGGRYKDKGRYQHFNTKKHKAYEQNQV